MTGEDSHPETPREPVFETASAAGADSGGEDRLRQVLAVGRGLYRSILRRDAPERLIAELCAALVRGLGYPGAWIVLTDPVGGEVTASAAWGFAGREEEFLHRFERGEGLASLPDVLSREEAVVEIPDAYTAERTDGEGRVAQAGLAWRLAFGGSVLGVLGVILPKDSSCRKDEEEFLRGLTKDLAFALTQSHDAAVQKAEVEETLRRDREKFRSFIENAYEIVYSASLEGVITYLSPNWETYVGIPPSECVGESFVRFVHPGDVAECRRVLAEIAAGRKVERAEYRIRSASGEWRRHVSTVAPLYDEAGNVDSCVGIARDVTEQHQAQKELHETRGLLETAVAQSPSGIIIADAPGVTIRIANPAAFGIRGGDPRVLTGIDVLLHSRRWNTFRPDGSPYPSELLPLSRAVIRGETTRDEEIIIRDEDGKDHWVSATAAPIRDAEERIVAGMVVFQDITERKRIEREKIEIEEQYRQFQKMEAIGRLTGGVAHDFNNLLLVINGYTELALRKLPEEHPGRKWLLQVAEAGDRAARLVEQLLLFSRRQILRSEDLDLNAVVSSVLNILGRVIGEDVRLDFVPGSGLQTVCADRGMMEQIVMNLGINARDAMPEGGCLRIETANITVESEFDRAHAGVPPGRWVLLKVSDTGCGMDAETLQRVFEPFFTTKEVGKGTGLGLATVYGIVKQHEGTIRVDSRLGKGTAFHVYLPAVDRLVVPEEKPRKPQPAGGTETILLAEDNDMVREYTVEMLRSAGYKVFVAADGWEAIELFNECGNEIDLLLFDIVMPRMGGREAWHRIKAMRPDIPILFASGYSESVLHTNFIQQEGLILIQKPFARDDLLRAIREILAKT